MWPLSDGPTIGKSAITGMRKGAKGRNPVGRENAFLAKHAFEQERRKTVGQKRYRDARDEDVGAETEAEDGEERGKHHGAGDAGQHPEHEAFGGVSDGDRGEGRHDHEAVQRDVEDAGLIGEEPAERSVNERRRDADGGIGEVGSPSSFRPAD